MIRIGRREEACRATKESSWQQLETHPEELQKNPSQGNGKALAGINGTASQELRLGAPKKYEMGEGWKGTFISGG